MAKKNTTKKNPAAQTNSTDESEQLSPAQLQAIHDGPDHGVRAHSRREVLERHGKDVVEANEARARKHGG